MRVTYYGGSQGFGRLSGSADENEVSYYRGLGRFNDAVPAWYKTGLGPMLPPAPPYLGQLGRVPRSVRLGALPRSVTYYGKGFGALPIPPLPNIPNLPDLKQSLIVQAKQKAGILGGAEGAWVEAIQAQIALATAGGLVNEAIAAIAAAKLACGMAGATSETCSALGYSEEVQNDVLASAQAGVRAAALKGRPATPAEIEARKAALKALADAAAPKPGSEFWDQSGGGGGGGAAKPGSDSNATLIMGGAALLAVGYMLTRK